MTSTVIIKAHAGTNLECVARTKIRHFVNNVDPEGPAVECETVKLEIIPNGTERTFHVHDSASIDVFERPVKSVP